MPIIHGGTKGGFPEPEGLKILEIGEGNKDRRTVVYSLEHPHPLYGKDPNVINELGHTIYPKLIYPNGKDEPGIMVKNAKEEAQYLNKEVHEVKEENHANEADEIAALEAKLAAAKERLAHKLEPSHHDEKDNSHPWS